LEKEIDGRREVELVYVLRKVFWGKGYATEAAIALKDYAFQKLALKRLVSLIDPENSASQRVATKVGMHYVRDTVRPGERVLRVYVAEDNADPKGT
jgi:ribosomal-protein-alanine N-acetyltransferase